MLPAPYLTSKIEEIQQEEITNFLLGHQLIQG
jgi:hypothetical protein